MQVLIQQVPMKKNQCIKLDVGVLRIPNTMSKHERLRRSISWFKLDQSRFPHQMKGQVPAVKKKIVTSSQDHIVVISQFFCLKSNCSPFSTAKLRSFRTRSGSRRHSSHCCCHNNHIASSSCRKCFQGKFDL